MRPDVGARVLYGRVRSTLVVYVCVLSFNQKAVTSQNSTVRGLTELEFVSRDVLQALVRVRANMLARIVTEISLPVVWIGGLHAWHAVCVCVPACFAPPRPP